MRLPIPLSLLLVLALSAGPVTAQETGARTAAVAQAGEHWSSYRDAYRTMLWFEKYGKPKQFIQSHYQLVARDKGASLAGLRLDLVGKSQRVALPLDAAGRAAFPLLKAAYDENAELTLNRPAGQFGARQRVSILPRADGVYDVADLRVACEQLLDFQRYLEPAALRGKRCAGVRFAFEKKDGEPQVTFRAADGAVQPLAASDGGAFWDDPDQQGFRIVELRFAHLPARGQLLTHTAPLAIGPLFD